MTKVILNCLAQEDEASHTRSLAAGVNVAGQAAQARESRTAVPPQEEKWDVSSLSCMGLEWHVLLPVHSPGSREDRLVSVPGAIQWPSFPYFVFPRSWMYLFTLLVNTHFVPGGNGAFFFIFFLFNSPSGGAPQRVEKEEPVCFNN